MNYAENRRALLAALSATIPRVRQELGLLGELMGASELRRLHHPVLSFAIFNASNHIVEHALLRIGEALDPFLEEACEEVGLPSIFVGRGRRRRPRVEVLATAYALRNEMVAHRVKLSGPERETYRRFVREYPKPDIFLLKAFAEVEVILTKLESAGYFGESVMASAAAEIPMHPPFTGMDVNRLIAAANAMWRRGANPHIGDTPGSPPPTDAE